MDKRNLYNIQKQTINNFYKEVGLGNNGIQYIIKNLKYGKTLSQSLLKMKSFELFDAKTFAHVDITDEKLNLFEQGGINQSIPEKLENFEPKDGSSWGKRSPNMDFWLVPIIQDFLSAENRILIIEDNESSPKDPWLQKYPDLPILTYKDELYFYLFQAQSGRIKEIFSFANSWIFIAMLTSLPVGETLSDQKPLAREAVELLAERAEKIIVGAYDREGYIIAQIA